MSKNIFTLINLSLNIKNIYKFYDNEEIFG